MIYVLNYSLTERKCLKGKQSVREQLVRGAPHTSMKVYDSCLHSHEARLLAVAKKKKKKKFSWPQLLGNNPEFQSMSMFMHIQYVTNQ